MRTSRVVLVSLAVVGVLLACDNKQQMSERQSVEVAPSAVSQPPAAETDTLPKGARAIIAAYPDFKLQYKDNAIVFEDGTAIVYDDGRKKTFSQLLDASDLEDMFALPYDTVTPPGYQHDGGRSRSEAFYKKMYGGSAEAVRKQLVTIEWFGQRLQVTRVNGVDRHLAAVRDEIARHPELIRYAKPSSGTFYWRQVRGAKRLSAHSYGMTIDLNTNYSNYWQWSNHTNDEDKKIRYENRIPRALVDIFRRHGFIWGGHWYHYDTMHFEYRPEILAYFGL